MKQKVEIELSIDELAHFFCDMSSIEQRRFFDRCAEIGSMWAIDGEHCQWTEINNEMRSLGTEAGKKMLRQMAGVI